jgi:hypothetical protein
MKTLEISRSREAHQGLELEEAALVIPVGLQSVEEGGSGQRGASQRALSNVLLAGLIEDLQ